MVRDHRESIVLIILHSRSRSRYFICKQMHVCTCIRTFCTNSQKSWSCKNLTKQRLDQMKFATLKSQHKIIDSLAITWSTYFMTCSIQWRWSDRLWQCVFWTRKATIFLLTFSRQCEFFIINYSHARFRWECDLEKVTLARMIITILCYIQNAGTEAPKLTKKI